MKAEQELVNKIMALKIMTKPFENEYEVGYKTGFFDAIERVLILIYKPKDTGRLDKIGRHILEGHIVTTYESETEYQVGFVNDVPVLIGIKNLSEVNCTSLIKRWEAPKY